MDIRNSENIKNNVKIKSILIALVVYGYLAVITLGIALIFLVIIGIITIIICNKEINSASSYSNKFNKNYPFRYFGQTFGEFQHMFYHSEDLEKKLFDAIELELKSKTPIQTLEAVTITDIDKGMESSEDRIFIKAESEVTTRGTTVTLILHQSHFGKMQSIQWSVMAGGYIDNNKRFNFIAYSPFTFLFWIIPYLKRKYDLLSEIRTIYTGSFNDMDVVTQTRCLHETVFSAMIEELEKNDIDISELRVQKLQVMNINISGGKVKMGNIVQGAMNKVFAKVKGK